MGIATVAAAQPGARRARSPFLAALDMALGDPALWLFGAAGFMLRGGVLVLLAPLVALPSPVEIRLLLGEGLGSTGFSTNLAAAVGLLALVTTAVAIVDLFVIGWLELAVFERIAAARGRLLTQIETPGSIVSRLFSVYALTAAAIALATVPLIAQASAVAYDEIVRPSGGAPLYERVLAGVHGPLILLGAVIIVLEVLSAVAARRVLGRACGVHRALGRRWWPLIGLLGWAITFVALVPALWALSLVWQSTRTALFAAVAGPVDPLQPALAVTWLVAVWSAALVLAGFASALRGALWTLGELG